MRLGILYSTLRVTRHSLIDHLLLTSEVDDLGDTVVT